MACPPSTSEQVSLLDFMKEFQQLLLGAEYGLSSDRGRAGNEIWAKKGDSLPKVPLFWNEEALKLMSLPDCIMVMLETSKSLQLTRACYYVLCRKAELELTDLPPLHWPYSTMNSSELVLFVAHKPVGCDQPKRKHCHRQKNFTSSSLFAEMRDTI